MNLYGPAENFNNVPVGTETTVTVYGKTFTGPYKGDSAASGGVLMYGVTIGSSLYTNGKGYVYDCTVTVINALRVNSGGSYEIINTVFDLASAGNGLVLNQASTNVTTVSGSTFRTGSNISVTSGDILEFQNTNYINADISISSGTVRLANNAGLVFGNSSDISIGDLTFGSGNSITFAGTNKVAFASGEDFTGVSITVDTSNLAPADQIYTLATNVSGVTAADITVTDPDWWRVTLTGTTLKAETRAIVAAMYGPADKFGGASVGDKVAFTAYGKKFAGTYYGDSAANGGVMMYGVTISSTPYTNGKGYVYDCTVTGGLQVNSGGSYEIVNTVFQRSSSGYALLLNQASTNVTTVTDCSFTTANSQIYVKANDILEFRGTNYVNAAITVESGAGTVRLADDANLVFGNSSGVTIGADLTFGSGNSITFRGAGLIKFDANENLAGVAITVDTTNYSISSPTTYTVAKNFAGVAVEDITVTGANSQLWTLSLNNGELTATSNFTKVTNLYGPAEKFPGATVGETTVITAYGKNFVGTYQGDGVGNTGSMMYGSTISTQPYTNGQNYVYDCTVSNQLIVNSGGAYEIVNTTFNRASSGNVLWVRQTSSRVTTISGSTFLTNNNISVESGNVVEFRDTNYFNANISIVSGTVRLADDAALVFGNTTNTSIGDLTFGSGNAVTLKGTGKVTFASGESFAGVAVTVDTSDFALAQGTYTLAGNFAGVAVEDITVTGTNSELWNLTLSGGTLTAKVDAVSVTNIYGPAERFPGASVGDQVFVTAEGKNFLGTYQGDSVGNSSSMMYGSTISTQPYTNSQSYIYDCTVSNQLIVNSGGAYEIVNTTFNRASSGNVLWVRQTSSRVTTISGSTFLTGNNIAVESGDVVEFRDTNYFNGSITIVSGTVRLADDAALVLGNTSTVAIGDLTFGSGNAITLKGTGLVGFASGEDFSNVALTVDTSDFAIDTPRTYTLAQNVGGVAVEDITVTGAYSNLWTLSLNNGTLTATSDFTKVTNLYGPAEKFPGATVGETAVITAYGKNFVGTYQGDSAASGSVMMYGVTIGSGLYTNGQAYAYDCTVSGQLKANSGGAYEIVNTTFNRTSSYNVIWLAQASSKVTTVSGSTFLTGNNIAVEAGDVLEFRDTNYLNANIAIGSTGGTVRLADNAALVFGNTTTISVAALTLGTGNAFTFNGTAQVNFASQNLSAAAITVSADLLGESTVIATGVALAADQGITVGDNTYTLGETFTYGGVDYAFSCTGNTFSVADVTKYDEVFVAPDGTQSIVIDGETIPLAGKPVYTSLDSALDHMAANGSVTVYNTTDSVSSTYAYFMSTQTVNGDLNIVADGLDFTRYYIIGNNSTFGNVSGDIYFEFRNAETQRIMLSGENQAHNLCRNGVITVKDATVTGYVSGGGSGANCRIAGDITINVTDSDVAAVYATRGNPVGGEAVVNLSGSTVGTVAKTDGAAVAVPVTLNVIGNSASEITGDASGLDAITVASGATLQLGAGAAIDNTVVKAGGALEIASGADTGAKLTLDFSGAASGAATDINDLGLIGASTAVYVEGLEQSYGTFTLGYGATGNEAFALGFGDGNDYTMDGTLTSVVDAFTGKTYTTSVDAGALKITAAAGTHTIAAVNTADSLAVSGTTFNGSDREAKWTENTAAATNVYLASGMTDGNAWLEIDGYNGSTATTLYGTAANQVFDGAVNLDIKSGSLRNLAAGAGTGGSVKAVNLTFDGATLNGTGYAGGFGSVTGTTDTQIADGTFTKDFYAGALANKLTTATSVGDVAMTIAGGTFSGNIYGASAVKTDTTKGNGTRHTAGDVTLTVTGGSTTKGTQACIFAGGYATGDATGTVYTVDSVTLDISGGDWGTAAGGRGVFGGIMASGVEAQVLGTVNITISGDATMGNVYGGGWAQKTNGRSVVGDVNISIEGGTITNVFGGGSHSTTGGTTETGDVTITVSGGSITGAIYARGQLDGDITGAASVIFTGSDGFDCDVYGYSRVGGDDAGATLSFNGYTGEFSGALGGFTGITLDGATAMTLDTAASDILNGAWEFDLTGRDASLSGTSLLTWSSASFTDDTIKVTFADDTQAQGGWNIATVAEAFSGTTFAVEVAGSEIATNLAYGQQIASGDYAGFGFELEGGVLKFKNIA